ncbi:MAG: RepB family plasmid replication initiator protein [Clostridia bacterium]|nr:RepB family plasmid replication initiator protein [Clostridia bacterium]MBQ3113920.1 RepB family plasmid replication initiator protein [Phascolarctobacterium sp.]
MDNLENLLAKPVPINLPTLNKSVKICNGFDEISGNLNVLEWKFLFAILAVMVPDKNKKGGFILRVSEIADLFELQRNRKRIIWNMLDILWEKTICWGERGRLRWFYRLEPFEGNDDFIYFRMDEDLANFLLRYDKGYVLAKFEEIFRFKCKYSFQLYFITVKAKKFRKCKYEVSRLIDFLEVPASYNLTNLRTKVLCPAIKEINQVTNLRVEFTFSRDFRFVNFQIIEVDTFFESLNPQAQVAYTYFADQIKVTKSAIIHCVNTFGQEVFEKIYREIRSKNPNEVKNMAAYAATCLRNGYYTQTPEPKKIETRLQEPLEDEIKQTPEEIEQQKIENEKAKEEQDKIIQELKSLPDDEQERIYFSVLLFCKKIENKILLKLFSAKGMAACLTDNSIISTYIQTIRKMRGDFDGKES